MKVEMDKVEGKKPKKHIPGIAHHFIHDRFGGRDGGAGGL